MDDGSSQSTSTSNMKHNIILTYQLCLQEEGLAREKTTYKYAGEILRVGFKILIHQNGAKVACTIQT